MKDKKCQGCGITLQNNNPLSRGFTENLEKDLCQRCFKLKHYGQYKEINRTNEEYLQILSTIPNNALVLYICDIFSLKLDLLSNFNNILLVLTKRDTLPKSVKDINIINYITKRYSNLLDIEIVSSIHNYNLDNLMNKIKTYYNNKAIYLVGYTNSGKSTLLNKIIKNYSINKTSITTSMYPQTTLDKIEIKLDNNLTLIDTPGLINEYSLIEKLPLNKLKRFNIKKEVKPRTFQINNSGSLIIDDIIRIDYKTAKTNSITIYINNGVKVAKISSKNESLKDQEKYSLTLSKDNDIVIDDICFMKFVNPIDIDIYTYSGINIRKRDNLI